MTAAARPAPLPHDRRIFVRAPAVCIAVTTACAGVPAATSDSGTTGTGSTEHEDTTLQTSSGSLGQDVPARFDVSTVFDLPSSHQEGCKVGDAGNAPPTCHHRAPADSFEPVRQWGWDDASLNGAVALPLVANLTDDNGDQAVDLCDIPDVVVVGIGQGSGLVIALDGETGAEHWRFGLVQPSSIPAIGDIDDDGYVEIIVAAANGQLTALNHDGSVLWAQSGPPVPPGSSHAMALADLDHDGDVEIVTYDRLSDHTGKLLWSAGHAPAASWSASMAADLDGDGDLEIIMDATAYHHDGSILFENPGVERHTFGTYAQVADFDDDPHPEVLIAGHLGLTLLDHNGDVVYFEQRPTGEANDWNRPIAIHDMDGDGGSEYAASAPNSYSIYEPWPTPQVNWTASVADLSGHAGGTAFDFLGHGLAQAIYADEDSMFAYNEVGGTLMKVARQSLTQIEYPVVVDVDNDGSAEVVVVSTGPKALRDSPAVEVVREIDNRWIQARRIWNQHTYHVTNINEDGTIPRFETPHWQQFNTFRTQAQIEGGTACIPQPVG